MKYTKQFKNHAIYKTSHANRGMLLESDLNLTNTYYLDNNIAVIYKKPTPIKIVRIALDYRKCATINEAYFQSPTTTDYNGLYKGKYIDFEAKEIQGRKSFPLNNINSQQIKHIRRVLNHGGIAFIVVRFSILNKTFLLKGEDLITIIDSNNRKSIPLSTFESKGYIIKEAYRPRLDYIKIIDQIYLGG